MGEELIQQVCEDAEVPGLWLTLLRVMSKQVKHYKGNCGDFLDTRRMGGPEIRIWVGFGIIVSRIFIMRELTGKQEALFITAKPGNRKGEITMATLPLAPPKSGWTEFAEFLRNHGIDSPMKLSLDRHEPDPDEEAIAIEVKSDAGYELVFYLLSSKTENARKAFDACQEIEQEFGIQMGCQY